MNPFSTIPFQGQQISPNNAQSLRLKSGAVYLFPYGNFLVKPGPQTAIQWLDGDSGLWRTAETGPVNHPIFVPSDGTNYRAINVSGTITGVNITAAGTLYTQLNTTVSFAAPVAGGIQAVGIPVIGGSLTLTVTTAGSGYTNPIIVIDPPQIAGGTTGQCIPAVFDATLTTGTIAGTTAVFAGAGYVQIPNVTVLDPTGTGAVITASISNGTATSGGLTGIIMTNMGAGYDGTHIPAVTITSATGSSATATALPSLALTSITVAGTNTGYTANALLESSLGSGVALASPSGDSILGRPARAVAVQTAGVLGTPVIEDAGNGFQTVPLVKQVGNATADGSVNATFVAVVGGVTNSLILWQIG